MTPAKFTGAGEALRERAAILVQHFLIKGVEKEAGKQYIRKRP
jgi:hypothetical protein